MLTATQVQTALEDENGHELLEAYVDPQCEVSDDAE
jgi:hypothetical protein